MKTVQNVTIGAKNVTYFKAVDDAVLDSHEVHKNQMMQLLSDPTKAAGFARVVFDLLKGIE